MREFTFLPGSNGALCAMHWVGDATCTPIMLLAPLQEELNKSRRQLHLIADCLSAIGHAVLLVDYYGTGDSEGDWQDATLHHWHQDVRDGLSWLANRYPKPAHLVSLRAGSLCVPPEFSGQWTACFPLLDGKTLVHQWLRQKLFASRLAGGSDSQASLTEQWRQQGLELAGYFNSPTLFTQLLDHDLNTLPLSPRQVLELGTLAEPTPAMARFCAAKTADWRALPGEAFWQSAEIAVIDALPGLIAEAVRA